MDLEEFYRVASPRSVAIHVLSSLDVRWELIKDDIFAGAFLLDPRYRKTALDDDDYLEGKNFLRNLAGEKWVDIESEFLAFRAAQDPEVNCCCHLVTSRG